MSKLCRLFDLWNDNAYYASYPEYFHPSVQLDLKLVVKQGRVFKLRFIRIFVLEPIKGPTRR